MKPCIEVVCDAFLNPPLSVFSPIIRYFLPILCIAFVLCNWCGSDVYAQLADARSRSFRNDRETRTVQPVNPAQVMMQEMQASLQKLPWSELSPASQGKIKKVVSDAPLFRRMPQQTVYADPEIFNFLLQHPDVVIGFWENLGATQLSLREVKENRYILKETAGTSAAVDVLYRTNDLCIVYAQGEYRGPLIAKPYSGDVLLILRSRFMRDSMNEPMVICDLDAFIQIDSLGADMLAKLFFTSLAKTADSNFEVTVSFVSQVSRAASRNTAGLKGSAEGISSIRQEVFEEFCDVVDRTAMRFARRNQPTPLARMQRQAPMSIPFEQERAIEEKPPAEEALLTFSKPPAEWGMDHFQDTPPFFESKEDDEKLDAPKVIETNSSERDIPKLPKPGK